MTFSTSNECLKLINGFNICILFFDKRLVSLIFQTLFINFNIFVVYILASISKILEQVLSS